MTTAINRRQFLTAAAAAAGTTGLSTGCSPTWSADANAHEVSLPSNVVGTRSEPLLFSELPALRQHIPWISLGSLATPLQRADALEPASADRQLWVKRDDLSSHLYGGNKVRKLEFLIGDAMRQGAKSLITVGGIGSHQCLATSVYGKALGLDVHLCMFPQPVTHHARLNLLADAHYGANFVVGSNYAETVWDIIATYRRLKKEGKKPYFIYSGGSTPLGTLGYFDAILELKEQIEAGAMDEPDVLFVPAGSCGTLAGIAWGIKYVGLKTQVIGVRVVDLIATNGFVVDYLIEGAESNLMRFAPKMRGIGAANYQFDHTQFGGQYGRPTEQGKHAKAILGDSIGIPLELTYSAKTFAAVLDYLNSDASKGQTILFWDTYNSIPYPEQLPAPSELPASLQWAFETTPVG